MRNTIGIVVVAALAASVLAAVPGADDDRSATAHQIGGQLRQPLRLVVRPAIFYRHVLAFDEAVLAAILCGTPPAKARWFPAHRSRDIRSPALPVCCA